MPSLSQLLSQGQPGFGDDANWDNFVRENYKYGPDVNKSIYGEGFTPNTGIDKPVTGTPQLSDYVSRYGSQPEWLKTASEYDPGFFGAIRAIMAGDGPEVLNSEGKAMVGTGGWTLPGMAMMGAGLKAPALMNAGRAAARNSLMDDVIARSAARAAKPTY